MSMYTSKEYKLGGSNWCDTHPPNLSDSFPSLAPPVFTVVQQTLWAWIHWRKAPCGPSTAWLSFSPRRCAGHPRETIPEQWRGLRKPRLRCG